MRGPAVLNRAVRAVRHAGLRGTAARALTLARRRVQARQEHVWFELPLHGDRPRRSLPEEVQLTRASAPQVELVAEFGRDVEEAAAFHAEGHDLWLAVDGETPLFTCWIFKGRVPAVAAPGGWLELPPGVACLEDSLTTPAARGRGIAPAAWTSIADALVSEGLETMITKVETENAPTRKAVAKAGFREIGIMRFERLGPRKRVSMESVEGSTGKELAARLEGPT
jgi:L-amino acid N-acyltransferase YncA